MTLVNNEQVWSYMVMPLVGGIGLLVVGLAVNKGFGAYMSKKIAEGDK